MWRAITLFGIVLAAAGPTWSAVERAKIDFEFVRQRALQKSRAPFVAPAAPIPPRLETLTYDEYRRIEFRPANALWQGDHASFVVHLFPRGGLFRDPVAIHEFSASHVQRVPFNAEWFQLGQIKDLPALPAGTDYAGFKVLYPLNRPNVFDELISFLGASYFRALGAGQHYGLSARGLALDAGIANTTEEFPRFSEFWLGKPEAGAATLTMYALLEGPSVAGAYEFVLTPGASTFVDVHTVLIFRDAKHTIGIAPFTSMYWYGENTTRPAGELRPEVHDSDGLLVQYADDQIWRPLAGAPGQHEIKADGLRRFGLLQRDRAATNYEDLEARYDTRPSAWIEPREGFGRGTVRLIELPASKEYADNVVTYWVPEAAPAPDQPLELRYRIVWSRTEPAGPPGRVEATRAGDRPGGAKGRMFWVDFADPKAGERVAAAIKPEVDVGDGGRLIHSAVSRNPVTSGWRVAIEAEATATHPIELRCRIRDAEVFTETWSYTWNPQP